MTNQNFLNSNYKNTLKPQIPVFDQSETVFFNTCFDKNQLKNLLAWFLEKYGEKVTVDFLETLKQVGFHQATMAGVSLGVDDLQIPTQKPVLLSQALVKISELTNATKTGNITSVEKSQRLIDTWNQTSEILRQTAVQNFRLTNPVNPIFMMAFSGARGNISQVRQLVAMRGLMADPQGAILEFPIQSNFREGLTITEYLISCYGARKGLVDTALRTATSGYLTRRLVDAVQHVVVVMTDCKTKKGILLKNKNLEQRLLGRVLLENLILNSTTFIEKNTLISKTLAKRIALKHKEIYVRSPLTCNTEKSVCQLCYGLNLAQGKIVSIGEAVGVIAGQSIGEPGTQLTMRTFHTGGVGVFSDQAMKSFNAPFPGKIEFVENLPGLFVRTPYGNIVYLLKHRENTNKKPILRLHPGGDSEVFEIFQNEVPAGSILWVKQGEYVKTGQLILQASQIKTSKQQMPESSHPVPAPYSGQVFFESMVIRVIQKQTQNKGKKRKKKEDDITPTFRTLTELGNFWVFSSSVQKEYSVSKSFFLKGDLVSTATPVFQYTLHIPTKGQLKRKESQIVLGQPCFDFLFSKSFYSKRSYFLIKRDLQALNTIVVYNNNPKKCSFTVYPTIQNFQVNQSGYCSIFWHGSDLFSQKGYLLNDKTVTDRRGEIQPSLFWSDHKIFQVKNITLLEKQSGFLLNSVRGILSKSGIFQFKVPQKLKWLTRTFLPVTILKNCRLVTKQSYPKSYSPVSKFVESALQISRRSLCINLKTHLIQKRQGWFYVPEKEINKCVSSQLNSILLEPGKKFEQMSFSNSTVSFNFIQTDTLNLLKSKLNKNSRVSFYSLDTLLNSKIGFQTVSNELFFLDEQRCKNKVKVLLFTKYFFTEFCFYKIKLNSLAFQIKTKRQLSNILLLQQISHYFIPDLKFFKHQFLFQNRLPEQFELHSPFSVKQVSTHFENKNLPQYRFKMSIPAGSDWVSVQNLLKLEITLDHKNKLISELFPSQKNLQKFHSKFKVFSPEPKQTFASLSFLFYTVLKLQNSKQFSFKTFQNSWVLPEYSITGAFLKSKKLGEFSHLQINQNSSSFSVLRNTDIITLKLPFSKKISSSLKIGSLVRWGQEISPGFAIPVSGQIIKLTPYSLTIRRGIPILASARGVVHVFNNDLIEKNDLLITLKSRRLQTEDIVQGIPKIEQLFEARETQGGKLIPNSPHTKLQTYFSQALQSKPLRLAVNESIQQIQFFLVENILEAYSNQGVKISEKHVEIVVRQMTARVRILSGGDSGLLPGEIVQLKWLERVNNRLARLGSRQARYEPLILGITKSVLQSESFLVAASFQEVSRVLVRSALTKKTDFLRGLHENVILGQLIPAGTGIISRTNFTESSTPILEKRDGVDIEKNLFLSQD